MAIARRSAVPRLLAAFGAVFWRDAGELGRHLGVVAGNLVVPVVVLLVASAGFSGSFGRALGEPYDTYVTFADYLVPGLAGLVVLFAVTRSALALVGEPGEASMRVLTATPLPRWFVMFGRLASAALLATIQAALFIAIAPVAGVDFDFVGWLLALPALLFSALMAAAVIAGLLVFVRGLRSFAAMVLFVVLPAFFVSSALYPLWKFTDYGADYLKVIATANPFTHAVELIRFASERQLDLVALGVVVGVGIVAFAAAMAGGDPARGRMIWGRRRRWAAAAGE